MNCVIKHIDQNSFTQLPKKIFFEPIDHILVRYGFCSERSASTFIKKNEILAGENCTEDTDCKDNLPVAEVVCDNRITGRNFRVDASQTPIFINGKQIPFTEHLYILIDKPLGVVCSKVSDRHETIFDILTPDIKSHPLFGELHCVGRLDSDTTGLVILTTNGSFSNYLTAPKSHVEKTYEVTLRDDVPIEYGKGFRNKFGMTNDKFGMTEMTQSDYIKKFSEGIELPPEKKSPGFRTKPAVLVFQNPTGERLSEYDVPCSTRNCTLTISEGKFHQVRRMFSAMGNEVTVLRRISFGEWQI